MMQRKAVPVRYLLLGAFLLASLLPTLLITGLAFNEARATLKIEIEHDMEIRAIATANEVDRMMFERLQNAASWSKLEIMQDIRIGDVDKRLSRFLSELKSSYRDVYTELDVVDNNGLIVASSNPEKIGTSLHGPDSWMSTRLTQTAIQVSHLTGDQLPISVAIEDSITGSTLGTLVTVFNWQQIHLVLENAVSGRGAAALLDRNDHLLAQTGYWRQIQSAPTLSAFAVANGYQGFSGFSWQIEILQDRSQVLAPIRQMAYIFISILVIAVLLASIIVIPLARSITRPLARLTQFANNFMRAPSSTLPPSGGPAEVDMMARAFGKMISDLESSRADLTRAAKLAVAGEMAAAMSHEVRTPLGILRSSAQLLLREPGLSDEAKEVCGFIISETDRLNKLVSTLIDSARPRTPEFAATDMTELARQTAAMLRAQAQKKDILLDFETGGPAMAYCDAEQITQVLLNLLLNAIQVLPAGGRIVIKVWQTAEGIMTSIADNGPGIPEEMEDKIFDPFFTQREGGIGLGLAVVRQIVLAHHGKISAGKSEMGGAEFHLELPPAEITSE
jgi:signal transduction histidine kinase